MTIDSFRAIAAMAIAVLVLLGGFYSLVLYPYELDQLVKGAIIGFMSTAIAFVFSQEIAKTTANSTTKALLTQAPETTTIDAGPPVTVTTTPNP